MQRLIQRGGAAAAWPCPDGMSSMLHGLLVRRGVSSEAEAAAFLHPSEEQLVDPFLLSGMQAAVERILEARARGERTFIFGDYDVDGVSACALLSMYLRSLGMDVGVYIPSRHEEGYGLNESAVREIAEEARLMITVDCGVSCIDEVAFAKRLGMDVVVTDHHRPGDVLPDCTVVNPLLNDYPFSGLCGAGVAFKLALAIASTLERERGEVGALPGWSDVKEYVDLAALATVADIVPLVGENRVIVSLGLERINECPRPGIAALIHEAGLDGKTISAGNIGFQLAPRLNASGRLGDARRAMMLLTATGRSEAAPIARELEEENANRRAAEQKIVQEALARLESYDLSAHRMIVISGEGWNSGVIGLAASRLVSRYYYPVILLSEKDGICTGSCRSIPGVDVFEALSSCADLFIRFGGHRQAAGLTIERSKVEEMIARLDEYVCVHVERDEYIPELEYDLQMPLCEVTEEAVRQMELMQPTGYGNPSPVILSEATIRSARAVGRDGAHLQMKLSDGESELSAVCFGAGARAGELAGETERMLYAPQINVWRDRISVQCDVKNILESGAEAVFERFQEKYPRYLRTYLTEVLYNIELNSSTVSVERTGREQVGKWLSESPQGTAVAVATREGALSLRRFLQEEGLFGRTDARAGAWGGDERSFNCASLCPAGRAAAGYDRVILWDAPRQAFPTLPRGRLYRLDERFSGGWMRELPDVDRLRVAYVAARALTQSGPILRMTAADIDRELAREAGMSEVEAMASLAALRSMGLISPEPSRLELTPFKKTDPARDAVCQTIQQIRDHAI